MRQPASLRTHRRYWRQRHAHRRRAQQRASQAGAPQARARARCCLRSHVARKHARAATPPGAFNDGAMLFRLPCFTPEHTVDGRLPAIITLRRRSRRPRKCLTGAEVHHAHTAKEQCKRNMLASAQHAMLLIEHECRAREHAAMPPAARFCYVAKRAL